MRILVVTNMWPAETDPTYGIFVQEQVESVRRLGVEVDVLEIDGRSSRVNYFRSCVPIRRRLASGQYNVVHAHYVLTGLVTWAAGIGLAGPPLVVTHHGVEVFSGWQAPLARWLTARASRTLVISARMAVHLGLSEDDVLPCGVDLDLFRPGSRADARRDLNLDGDDVLVAWVGQDRPEKRLDLARTTIASLQAVVPSAKLHVVCDVPHSEVALHIRAADALLVTSTWEGGPLVVKEALACDRTVVSTDVGDVPELVAGLPGCSIADADPNALARSLVQAVAAGETSGRQCVLEYSLERVAARLIAVYDEVAGRTTTEKVVG